MEEQTMRKGKQVGKTYEQMKELQKRLEKLRTAMERTVNSGNCLKGLVTLELSDQDIAALWTIAVSLLIVAERLRTIAGILQKLIRKAEMAEWGQEAGEGFFFVHRPPTEIM